MLPGMTNPEGPYSDRDEEIVATVLAADNLYRNLGQADSGGGNLKEAAERDSHNWRLQARQILDALTAEGWEQPERDPHERRALWMRTD